MKNLVLGLLLLSVLVGAASAASSTVNLQVTGLPAGSIFSYRLAPNFTTVNYPITGYTTEIPIYISSSTNSTYEGAVTWQYQGAGTTVSYNGVTYTMLQTGGGTCNTQVLNTNGINDFCAFYIYLNSSLWNANEQAELKASNSSLNTAKLVVQAISNTTQSQAYGSVLNGSKAIAAGSTKKNATDTSGNIDFISTTVAKNPSYACINITSSPSIESQNICQPGTYHLGVQNVAGHFGIDGPTSIQLTVSLSSTLVSGNRVNYTALISAGGTTIYTLSSNQSSLSHTVTFAYNAGEPLNITLVGGGDANYSIDDPIVFPANVLYYIPVNILNTQGSAVSSNTPIPIGVTGGSVIGTNILSDSAYFVANMINTEWFYANGTIIKSWLQGNLLNQDSNTISTSANVLWWLQLGANVVNELPASMTANYVVYLGIAGNTVTTQNTLFGGNTGEAPQLSCINPATPATCSGSYAKWDTGNIVFGAAGGGTLYDNFSGASLKGIWSTSQPMFGGTATVAVDNGITITTSTAGVTQGIFSIPSIGAAGNVISFYGTQDDGNANCASHCILTGFEVYGTGNNAIRFETTQIASGTDIFVGTSRSAAMSGTPISTNAIWSLAITNSISATATINYGSSLTETSGGATFPQNALFGGYSTGQTLPVYLQWAWVSKIAPNNVDPTTTFGNLTSSYSSPTVTIPVPTNIVIDIGQYETVNTVITPGTANYVVTWNTVNSVTRTAILFSNTISTSSLTPSNTFQFTANSGITNYPYNAVVNVIVTDAKPTTVNSVYSANIQVYNTLVSTAFTATNAILDPGEYDTFTANITGGAPKYTYNFRVFNAIGSQIGNFLTTTSSNSVSYTFFDPTSLNFGADKANVVIFDSATTNAVVSNSIGFTGENALVVTIVPSGGGIDLGQSVTLVATPSGGNPSYSYQWYSNSACTSTLSGQTTNTLTESPSSSTTYCIKVTDSASTPASNTMTAAITVNPVLVAGNSLPSNAILNVGQSITLTTNPSGGTPPYNYQWYSVNMSTGCRGVCIYGLPLPGQTSNTLVVAANNIDQTGNYLYTVGDNSLNPCAIGAELCPFSGNSTITINPALTVSSWTALHSIVYTLLNEVQTLTVTVSPGTGPYTYNYLVYNALGGLVYSALYTSVAATSNSFSYVTNNAFGLGTYTANIIVTDLGTTSPATATATLTYLVQNSPTLNSNINGNTVLVSIGSTFLITASGPSGDNIGINISYPGGPSQGSRVANGITSTSYNFGTVSPYNSNIGTYGVTIHDITDNDPVGGNIIVYQPLGFQNFSENIAYPVNGVNPFSANTYYPFRVYANAGNSVVYNLNYTAQLTTLNNPVSLNNVQARAVYSQNTVLTGNITAYDVVINTGVRLTTDGYHIIAYNALIWNGYILGGTLTNGAASPSGDSGLNGGSILTSYGGSGGAGGAGQCGSGCPGGYGGNTLANGGIGGFSGGGSGSQASPPAVSNANILIWSQNFTEYFAGAGGGSGGEFGVAGGNGNMGLYIQGNSIYASSGFLYLNGTTAATGSGNQGGGGGGGGGVAIIAYHGTYTAPTSNVLGGSVGKQGGSGVNGGTGGNGNVIPYQYTTQPLATEVPSITTVQVYSGVANYSFVLPANSISGNYLFQTKETMGSNTVFLNASVRVNMTDFSGPLTYGTSANTLCETPFQYLQSCVVFPVGTNTFTARPSSWEILGDLPINLHTNGTGTNYNIANYSQKNLTFPTRIELYYSFTSFVANLTNNPKLQTTLTNKGINFTLSNTVAPGVRLLSNISVFSQYTFNAVTTSLSTLFNGSINGYAIQNTLSSSSYSEYYLQMARTNYQNPTITYTLNTSSSTPLYFFAADTFCPSTQTVSQSASYPIGLVDTNGSKYNFFVYSQAGQAVPGYIIKIIEQKGVGSQQVQSYKIPSSVPFVLALEATGQQYSYTVLNPTCTKTIAQTGFSVPPSNPPNIYINVSTANPAYVYNISQAQGQCRVTGLSGNFYNINCYAKDPTDLVFQYKVDLYNTTSLVGTTALIYNSTFPGSSFNTTFQEPKNRSYTYQLYGYAYNSLDPALLVNSGPLGNGQASLAAPLFGLMAFIIALALILGAARTGKLSVLMFAADAAMFVVAIVGVDVPLPVAIIFIIISCIGLWKDRNK